MQAMEKAGLDALYFLPERRPRTKQGVEHFGHRVAMLRRASAPHPKFGVLELEDVSFSVEHTLRRLRKHFPGARLVFLFGSDVAPKISSWPHYERFLKSTQIAISLRTDDRKGDLEKEIRGWPIGTGDVIIFKSHAPGVSSGPVRMALRQGKQIKGSLRSVERYSSLNWLYISIAEQAIQARTSSGR